MSNKEPLKSEVLALKLAVISDIVLGFETIHLYQVNDLHCGSIMDGNTAIPLIIYTEDAETIDLDCFEFDFGTNENNTAVK